MTQPQPNPSPSTLCCPKCRQPLTAAVIAGDGSGSCAACGAVLHVDVFPALFRPVKAGKSGETVLVEGESTCFYHPHKKAIVPCDLCGRFLCALCDLELSGQHLCPSCLESGRRKGKLQTLENRRPRYDSAALSLAAVPLFCFWPVSFLTAPVAIFVACRYWNKPTSLVYRGAKARYVTSIVLGIVQIVAWALFIGYLAFGHHGRSK